VGGIFRLIAARPHTCASAARIISAHWALESSFLPAARPLGARNGGVEVTWAPKAGVSRPLGARSCRENWKNPTTLENSRKLEKTRQDSRKLEMTREDSRKLPKTRDSPRPLEKTRDDSRKLSTREFLRKLLKAPVRESRLGTTALCFTSLCFTSLRACICTGPH
jgi:hypothetical protein